MHAPVLSVHGTHKNAASNIQTVSNVNYLNMYAKKCITCICITLETFLIFEFINICWVHFTSWCHLYRYMGEPRVKYRSGLGSK